MTTKAASAPKPVTVGNPRYAGVTPEQVARALLRNRNSVKKKSTRRSARGKGKFQSGI